MSNVSSTLLAPDLRFLIAESVDPSSSRHILPSLGYMYIESSYTKDCFKFFRKTANISLMIHQDHAEPAAGIIGKANPQSYTALGLEHSFMPQGKYAFTDLLYTIEEGSEQEYLSPSIEWNGIIWQLCY